ncbi:hypothetical protein BX600DRAFT_429473 [Xylariales sp. PMI_506]|nr:hypothetical protein BX600DRAFT_429473 [Xylariales sp. PMI_506]
MSSQNNSGIPLAHAPDGVGYKLLELPSELLALLESDDAPILTLESTATSAVLKHGSQSWSLRQKNTSNALILLTPCDSMPWEEEEPGSQIPESGLKAIATVHDTIELVPETTAASAPTSRGKWHEKFARGR